MAPSKDLLLFHLQEVLQCTQAIALNQVVLDAFAGYDVSRERFLVFPESLARPAVSQGVCAPLELFLHFLWVL